MNAADPFTRASPTYCNAMRHQARSGPAFEVTGRRPLWMDLAALLSLTLAGVFVLTVAAVAFGGGW
jgi:hypothetical protein